MSAIRLEGASKSYRLYDGSFDRLREVVTGRPHHREVHALHPVDLEIAHGEVVGIIGNNGAGKSTLLKLVTGTLSPSAGRVSVSGRVAALLELGGSFHPEMSGRENVYLGCAMAGLSRDEIDRLYPRIVEFSGVGEFIEQPVKTYSSGMSVRLAFSVATAVEPEILIIDEALSVGDGAFARKSFDRIMSFRDAGKTILFCSHALYQVESLCDRVVWLEKGRMMQVGDASAVVGLYSESLSAGMAPASEERPQAPARPAANAKQGRLVRVVGRGGGVVGDRLPLVSGEDDLAITAEFLLDPQLPPPTVGFTIASQGGVMVTSATSRIDEFQVEMGPDGRGWATIEFPRLSLLKGEYTIGVYLGCEQAVHVYDHVEQALRLEVTQKGLERGVVVLPHRWSQTHCGTAVDRAADR